MIVGVCGYGATGSGAVVALLKEYDELQVFDKAEFQYAFQVDGLQDLEYHLVKQQARHMSGDIAIHRFLNVISWAKTPIVKKTIPKEQFIKITNEYVDSLVQESWIGIDNFDYEGKSILLNMIVLGFKKIVFPYFEKITGKSWNIWPARRIYLSFNPNNFYEKTKNYTSKLLKAIGADFTKPVVLDQVFEGNAPENSFPFFENPKAIVVDRDPRDLWLVGKYAAAAKGEARFMPRDDVKTYVEYYRRLRKSQKKINTETILFLKFEDLIYEYDSTVKEIEKFLGISNHLNLKKYFNPDISINNTQLMYRYPECMEEIEYIERELGEYLFDFSKYSRVKFSGVMF